MQPTFELVRENLNPCVLGFGRGARDVWHREEEIDPSAKRGCEAVMRRAISEHFLRSDTSAGESRAGIFAQATQMSAKLDRNAVGSILWSKLVFLNQCPPRRTQIRRGSSPRWVGIDNESDQVS
jgi:hypothetical protein